MTPVRPRRVLLTDFDATMTKVDFFECVLARRDPLRPPPPGPTAWQRYAKGELTQFEALREIFATLPSDEAAVMEIARGTGLDPQLRSAIERLEACGWSVRVVSAGCDWYIERLLREQGVTLPVIANPGHLTPHHGLEMNAPAGSPFYDGDNGIDKGAVVRTLLRMCEHVAFAGNGRADLPAILLVPPALRFATAWLADELTRRGELFQPFSRWSEIAERLAAWTQNQPS